MRPLVLTMQAFGPYAHKETIDFRKLGNRTMFVISGKTGSGKTTIFDGISFAIYGKASGDDRNGQDLRSQFAPPQLETEVTLQFYLKGKRYYIIRTPKQLKKKIRGEGFREINGTAELYIFNDHGEKELLAAGVEEVDRKIKEIMQIDSHQFRQIMMIPQGEFRRLLTSDSKEKEVILQKLFHTELYKRIEEKLKDQSSELEEKIKNEIEDRTKEIGKIQAEFSEELKSYLEASSGNDVVILPLLIEEIRRMGDKLEFLSKELEKKEKEKEQLQQNLFEGENLVKQFQTLDALLERKNSLLLKQDEIKEKEREIQSARKASQLAQQDELCHRLKGELNRLDDQLREKRKKIEELSKLYLEKEKQLEIEKGKENERQKAQEQFLQLQSIHDEVKQLAEYKEKVRVLEKELSTLEKEQKALKVSLIENQTLFEKLREQKSSFEKVELFLVQNERDTVYVEQEINLLRKLEEINKNYQLAWQEAEENKGKWLNGVERLEDAKKLYNELQQKWLQGQAAILASHLQDGEACPVCGSTEHPNKSSHYGDLPTEADLQEAKKEVERYEKIKSTNESIFLKTQSQMSSYQSSRDELILEFQRKRPDFTVENLEAYKSYLMKEKNRLQEEKKGFIKKQQELERMTNHLNLLEEEKNGLELKRQHIEKVYHERNIQYTEILTTLKNMELRIPKDIQSYEMFKNKLKEREDRVKQLKAEYEKAEREWQEIKELLAQENSTVKTLENQKILKEKEWETEREIFKTKLFEEGFKSYREFIEAKRTDMQISILEQEVKDYFAFVRSVTDQYELLYESLKGRKMPNLEELKEAAQQIRHEIEKLNNDYTTLFVKKRTNEEIHRNIEEINRSLKSLEEKYKLIGELADIAKGKNPLRITFERYVLASFLDEILYEANIRLRKMTSGRYELRRKKDRAKGNVQSGLELLVFDQYTGQERHVKTLSGGESFKAALSLALGLADVVQSYAGGISLETMFIDEGFGTLDPESLDQAIETLIDIQSSGRLVGIISHVPELRERIDGRLEVIGTQTGSTTKFIFTNGEY